jgi:TPR repeat protein
MPVKQRERKFIAIFPGKKPQGFFFKPSAKRVAAYTAVSELFAAGVAAMNQGQKDIAIQKFLEAAKPPHNNVAAMNNLAVAYEENDNFVEARKWYMAAAKSNMQEASFNLGYFLLRNNEDYAALKYLKKASFLPPTDPQLLYDIATIYALQINPRDTVEQQVNLEDALSFIKKAIAKSSDTALTSAAYLVAGKVCTTLGSLFYKLTGETQGYYSQAEKFLQKAVELGNKDARLQLGYLYLENNNSTSPTDPMSKKLISKAKNYFEESATKDQNSTASYELGYLFYTEQKFDEAQKWLRLSADAKNSDALFLLGRICMKSNPPDNQKAIDLLTQATEYGNYNAAFHLGIIFETKISPPNLPQATYWYLQAALRNANNIKINGKIVSIHEELKRLSISSYKKLDLSTLGDTINANDEAGRAARELVFSLACQANFDANDEGDNKIFQDCFDIVTSQIRKIMTNDNFERLLKTLQCPISTDLSLHPVLNRQGYTYNLKSLESWLATKRTNQGAYEETINPGDLILNKPIHDLLRFIFVEQNPDISAFPGLINPETGAYYTNPGLDKRGNTVELVASERQHYRNRMFIDVINEFGKPELRLKQTARLTVA